MWLKKTAMDQDARDIGEIQSSLMKLETDVSNLGHRQHRTQQIEIETLMAVCMQIRSLSARLFDLQTRLIRRETVSTPG